MSSENTNEAANETGNEDLSTALSSGESEFVVAEAPKPAVSQGMLYLLLLIAIGGGVTFYMYKKQGPVAASAASVQTAQAQQTIDNFLTSGPAGMKVMQEMLRNTERIVQEFLEYPSVPQIPLSALHTNPFRFAKAVPGGKPDEEAIRKKRDDERTAALHASQSLNLQSIIHSDARRACMINNSLYLEGQQVEGFTIEKISPHAVVVKTGVYRFELRMQK